MPPETVRTIAEFTGLPPVSERFPEEPETLQRLYEEIPFPQSWCAD